MSILVIMSLLNGLTLGALLFITASGLTLSFSLMRVVNLTHGAFYMAGGFIGLSVLKFSGSWLLAVLAGGILMSALAFIEERFLLRWARGNDLIETLISLSVAIIIGDLVLVVWGGYPKTIAIPEALNGAVSIPLLGTIYPVYRIFMLGLALVIIGGLWIFLKKTRLGVTIRAGVDNFEMVSALGINVRRLFSFVFTLSGFLAGVSGVVGGFNTYRDPAEVGKLPKPMIHNPQWILMPGPCDMHFSRSGPISAHDHGGEKTLFEHEFMHLFVYTGQQLVNLNMERRHAAYFG
jgi:branched-chain amino acid transport system permease protein